jgi:hypothetical protein
LVEWDLRTITAGDYTVELEITEDMYERWYADHYFNDRSKGISTGESLKRSIIDILEHILTSDYKKAVDEGRFASRHHHESGHEEVKEILIADVVFAYDNADLIALLRERADYIKAAEWDKLTECEQRIEKLKNDEFKKLTRPVYAFITFEEDEGHVMALEYDKKKKFLCFGKNKQTATIFEAPLVLKPATEPTNIKWENRHYTAS